MVPLALSPREEADAGEPEKEWEDGCRLRNGDGRRGAADDAKSEVVAVPQGVAVGMLQECQESGAVERRRQGPEHGLRCLRVIDAEVVVAGAKQESGNDKRGCGEPAGRGKGPVYAGGEGLGENLGREGARKCEG